MDLNKSKQNKRIVGFACLTTAVIIGLLILVVYFSTKDRKVEDRVTDVAITVTKYGQLDDGEDVLVYSLTNKAIQVQILNYGATIISIIVPDRNGHKDDIALEFDSLEGYKTNRAWIGSFVGRYANRIANGVFTLDGVTYNLTINDTPNTLHGGPTGFHKRLWDPVIDGDTLVLTYVSADMEEGYPGKVIVRVTYRLTNENALIVSYNADTTKTTVINLTTHPYFNLAGQASKSVTVEAWIKADGFIMFQSAGTLDSHYIRLEADLVLPIDNTAVPTGFIVPVNGTKFDLLSDTNIGTRLLEIPGGVGFNHNYVFGKSGWDKHMARVFESTTGRTLDVYSTQPGVQFYTSYYLNGTVGKGGYVYPKNSAFCLETQHYPNSPNQPNFPTTTLRPGEVYRHTTRYVFGLDEV